VSRIGFEAKLIAGHGGVTAVIVPFDPRATWGKEPVVLDQRREGWLVKGTVNGVAFDGWIGFRWKRFFVIVEPALRGAAKIKVGDTVEVMVAPTTSASTLSKARDQAKLTTAPSRRGKRVMRAPRR
jgi:hypothetical protein